MSEPLLTLVLPTRNRPAFLARALGYYRTQGLRAPLLIADSSDEPGRPSDGELPPEWSHRGWPPQTPFLEKLRAALDLVDTPYVAIGADDDFFIPEALEYAARVLAAQPGCSVVHGQGVLVALREGEAHGPLAWAAAYRQRALMHPQAAERLRDHLLHYATTWYSVHRTLRLRAYFTRATALRLDVYFGELLPSCLAVIEGRAAKLDALYMVRQAHAGQNSPTGGRQLDLFTWMTHPDWARQYAAVEACLSAALVAQDGIRPDDARDTVREACWGYLAGVLSHDWNSRYGPKRVRTLARLRNRISRWPLARTAWHALRAASVGPGRWSLESLRHPASPHRLAFAGVENALSHPSELAGVTHESAEAAT